MQKAMAVVNEAYSDAKKLELYDETNLELPIGKHLFTYSTKHFLPCVKGKTVLDIPCGNGHYVREVYGLGAKKVIATDIASCSIEMSKQSDQKAGIPDGFVEYYEHDSRIAKQLGSELADVCLSIHLFCFAANEVELREMARMILINLKPGGCCMVLACLLLPLEKDEVQNKLSKIIDYEEVVNLDPITTDRFKPRWFHTIHAGFDFKRYIWPHDVIIDVLKEEGFSKVESVPYEVDPAYTGDVDLQAYSDLRDCKLIFAWK